MNKRLTNQNGRQKKPHIMWGKTGMVSMARKTGLLVTTGTAIATEKRRF